MRRARLDATSCPGRRRSKFETRRAQKCGVPDLDGPQPSHARKATSIASHQAAAEEPRQSRRQGYAGRQVDGHH